MSSPAIQHAPSTIVPARETGAPHANPATKPSVRHVAPTGEPFPTSAKNQIPHRPVPVDRGFLHPRLSYACRRPKLFRFRDSPVLWTGHGESRLSVCGGLAERRRSLLASALGRQLSDWSGLNGDIRTGFLRELLRDSSPRTAEVIRCLTVAAWSLTPRRKGGAVSGRTSAGSPRQRLPVSFTILRMVGMPAL
jgi:hypothetical protein